MEIQRFGHRKVKSEIDKAEDFINNLYAKFLSDDDIERYVEEREGINLRGQKLQSEGSDQDVS